MTVTKNADLAFKVRVTHADLDHKAVHLGAGQHLGTGRANGVLGRQHHEGTGQRIGLTVHSDPHFFHGFQQSGLGLAGGTVDFVCQQEVSHDSTGLEHKAAGLLFIHRVADDIRGHGIGSELDTAGI